MINHIWTVLCSRAVIDKRSNNVSIQNVIEQLSFKGKYFTDLVYPFPMEVVSLWERHDHESPTMGLGRVSFFDTKGEIKIEPSKFEIDLSNHKRNRSRVLFSQLPISEPGRHVFRVEMKQETDHNWETVTEIPLEVNFTILDKES